MKRNFLITKKKKKKKKANTVLNGEKLDISPLRFAAKQGYLSTPLLNILLKGR